MTDSEIILRAVQQAQTILACYIEPGLRNLEKTINELLEVLDRDELVSAVDRLEAAMGLRQPS